MKMKSVLIAFSVLFPVLAGAEESASKTTLASFILLLKQGKEEEAAAVTFSKPGEEAAAKRRVQRIVQRFKENPDAVIAVVDGKELGSVAVVIVKDAVKRENGKPDYDSMFMVKREGIWKLAFNATDLEDDPELLVTEGKKEFAELREWNEGKMQELSK